MYESINRINTYMKLGYKFEKNITRNVFEVMCKNLIIFLVKLDLG